MSLSKPLKKTFLLLLIGLISNLGFGQKPIESNKLLNVGKYKIIVNIQNLKYKVGKFTIGDSIIVNKSQAKPEIEVDGILKENPRKLMITFQPDTNTLSKEELLNKPRTKYFIFLLTSGTSRIIADDREGRAWRLKSPNNLQLAFQNYFNTLYALESYRPRNEVDYEIYRDSIAQNFLIPQFNKNKNNFVGAIVSNVLVGYLHKQKDCHFLDSIYNCLGEDIQHLPLIKNRIDKINKGCNYISREAQYFVLKNSEGKNVSLTDFKGQYLLIDIWASWCVPCRAQNQILKGIYQKYSKDDFNILSVSIDEKKSNWLKALEKDKLGWPQVSLLDESKTVINKFRENYYFSTIPSNFLVNPAGIIIAKDVTPEDLDKKLTTIFKKSK